MKNIFAILTIAVCFSGVAEAKFDLVAAAQNAQEKVDTLQKVADEHQNSAAAGKEAVADKVSEASDAIADKVSEASDAVADKVSETSDAIADKVSESASSDTASALNTLKEDVLKVKSDLETFGKAPLSK